MMISSHRRFSTAAVTIGLLLSPICRAEGPAAEQSTATAEEGVSTLAQTLTLYASFDKGLDADFALGDPACYDQSDQGLVAASANDDVHVVQDGRFGGALRFERKNDFWPAYKGDRTLGYNDKNWNRTVSVWLRLTPDEDLEPGYCDPVQIVGNDYNKGFIFLEWSKDERPRFFRYAIRPLTSIWNPENKGWDEIPFDKRPMIQVDRAPFSRDAWTHVVFTLENVNDKSKSPSGRLYLNGKPQGTIENWDLSIDWDPASVLLVLGASYVGDMDDLAVFSETLDEDQVKQLYELKKGAGELKPAAK